VRKMLALPLVSLSLVLVTAVPAAAAPPTQVIVLPGARSAEGIAAGKGSTFYASDLVRGDIFRGDIRRGTAELFIDAPDGTQSVGMDVDLRHDLLFVAGGMGKAYVYNARTGATVATYNVGDPATTLVNDVTVTPFGAWFTDSLQPKLYFVPIVFGVPGPLRTLELSGPAAGPSGGFFLNGITSTPSGGTLLVAPTPLGKLCTINPITGASELVANVDVPSPDGLVLDGRHLWVVQTFLNQVSRWRLSGDLGRGTPDGVITDPEFRVPLTAAKFGNRLAVVNSHLDTGFPPTHPTYEVIVVGA
jgi:sugar lactone lactonase YvrE